MCADFFTSCVQLRLPVVVTAIVLLYLTSFFSFGVVWYLVYRYVQHQLMLQGLCAQICMILILPEITAGSKVIVSTDFMVLCQPSSLQLRLNKL